MTYIANTITYVVDVSGGNKFYRLRFVANTYCGIDASDDPYSGGYARLDIYRLHEF